MKNRILDLFKENELYSLLIKDIANLLDINDLNSISNALNELVNDGYLVFKKNKYHLAKKFGIYRGIIQIKQQGYGFVTIEGKESDVFVPRDYINGAFNKDLVLVKINKNFYDDKKDEASVIKVLDRGTNYIVGEFKKGISFNQIISNDKSFNYDILVKESDTLGAIDGHIVKASIYEYQSNYVFAKVEKILGSKKDPGIDILAICYKYDLETKFSDKVYNEAKNIPTVVLDKDKEGRIDRRDKIIFTIDGDDTKDIDDAISVTKLPNGNYLLGVYIADVSYYVQKNTEIDKEAYLRGTSVYLIDRVIPMLPEQLCNGICSLNPDCERLAIACEMEIDLYGKVVNKEIFPTIIKSRYQMTYNNVNKIIDRNVELCKKYSDIVPMIMDMYDLSIILANKRFERGSIEFESQEPKIEVDKDGVPLNVYIKPRGISEGIIEEFMLMANECVAKTINKLGLPFIYRIHENPNPEKILNLIKVIKAMGHKVGFLSKNMTNKDCQSLLLAFEDKKEFSGINYLLLRSMMKAKYSEECLGHYGLGLEYYTHFTSPIRRYPDTLVHRMLREFLFEGKTNIENISYWENNLSEFARYTSMCEKTAVDCEREVNDMKMAEYMENHIGEVYEGIVSSLTNFGIFVCLDNGIEGLIHISNINNDYYEYDSERMIIIGKRSHKYFQLGDKLVVKVISASKDNQNIDFSLVKAIDTHQEVKKKKKDGRKYENHRFKQKSKL